MKAPSLRLGIDVGGTFTDFAVLDDHSGQTIVEKVLTTPEDPWLGVREGLMLLVEGGIRLDLVTTVIHGTTLVTNALIERRGARVGLLTTRGFRDILYFGREFRYDVYDPDIELPPPLIPRSLRREVPERVAADGSVLQPLDREAAGEVVRDLLGEGVEAVAICLLHSYRHPEHEQQLAAIVGAADGQVPISLSHQVLPQIREYERSSATAINAYVQPIARRYLFRLRDGLRELGCGGELYLMTSSGGTVTVETAAQFPIHLIESGPAAGALASTLVGKQVAAPGVIAFDMGGTTAKSCVIRAERPLINKSPEVARSRRFRKGSGLPVGIPMVDLLEIGAGGGSIAWIDQLGLLRVGPESSGASPGPACYGLGGSEPTVTDANVVLGLLDPASFLHGSMPLDARASWRAIEETVGREMAVDPVEAAAAIHRVVTDNMAESTRVHAVEVNVDVRGSWLVAFGGAGPLHAYGVAERLGLPVVVFPRNAGVLSACGLLAAPLAFEFSRSYSAELDVLDLRLVNRIVADLEGQGRQLLAAAAPGGEVKITRTVDMSYAGQRYEVTTPLPWPALEQDSVPQLKALFHEAYEEAYGRRIEGLGATCVTWRVLASGTPPDRWWNEHPAAADEAGRYEPAAADGLRRLAFLPGHGSVECRLLARAGLAPGSRVQGPALVDDGSSTIVVPPGGDGLVDAWGNIVIRLTAPASTASPARRGTGREGGTR